MDEFPKSFNPEELFAPRRAMSLKAIEEDKKRKEELRVKEVIRQERAKLVDKLSDAVLDPTLQWFGYCFSNYIIRDHEIAELIQEIYDRDFDIQVCCKDEWLDYNAAKDKYPKSIINVRKIRINLGPIPE